MGNDWNRNGRNDSFDRYIDYKLSSPDTKQNSGGGFSGSSSKYTCNTDKESIADENDKADNIKSKIIAWLWVITIAVYIGMLIHASINY
jgi:hypothetical protein